MNQKLPFLMTTVSVFVGVFIAILFGINEDIFKGKIAKDLKKNPKVVEWIAQGTQESEQAMSQFLATEKDKNWRYYQRFHFHSTGISAMTFGMLFLLMFLGAPSLIKTITSYMLAAGGFLYPFVWLFAGIYGPSMGRGAAKEAFSFFGYMGGIYLLGVALLIGLLARYPINQK